jgi:hypothetical protein
MDQEERSSRATTGHWTKPGRAEKTERSRTQTLHSIRASNEKRAEVNEALKS